MNSIKIVALKNGQMIVGKVDIEQEEEFRIISPRMLIKNTSVPGNNFLLFELLGSPDVITLIDEPVYIGDVCDKGFISEYIKSTTSLTIPN